MRMSVLQAEAGSSALATKEEEAAQLQQQLQQAESQVVTLQEAQAAMAADAAAKAGKLAHLEGALALCPSLTVLTVFLCMMTTQLHHISTVQSSFHVLSGAFSGYHATHFWLIEHV